MSYGSEGNKEKEKDALALFAAQISDQAWREKFLKNREQELRDLGIYGDLSPEMKTFLESLSLDELRLLSRLQAAGEKAGVGEKRKGKDGKFRFLIHF